MLYTARIWIKRDGKIETASANLFVTNYETAHEAAHTACRKVANGSDEYRFQLSDGVGMFARTRWFYNDGNSWRSKNEHETRTESPGLPAQ